MDLLLILARFLIRLVRRPRPVTYVFHCPACNQLRLVTHHQPLLHTALSLDTAPRHFTCQTCKKRFDATDFRPDSTGVFQRIT